jgi:hypothetical protein
MVLPLGIIEGITDFTMKSMKGMFWVIHTLVSFGGVALNIFSTLVIDL